MGWTAQLQMPSAQISQSNDGLALNRVNGFRNAFSQSAADCVSVKDNSHFRNFWSLLKLSNAARLPTVR
jgi:hypothetical protein